MPFAMATNEELEWKKANGNPLKRALPMLCGILLAAIFGGATFAGVAAIGNASVKEHARLEADGYEEMCMERGVTRRGPCNQGTTGAIMIAAPAVLSLIGFALGFALGGGKISKTYFQGVQ
jgi:hypothetical protein